MTTYSELLTKKPAYNDRPVIDRVSMTSLLTGVKRIFQ